MGQSHRDRPAPGPRRSPRADFGLVDHRAWPDLRRLGRRAKGADRAGPEDLGSLEYQDTVADHDLGSGGRVRMQGVGNDRGVVQNVRVVTDLDDATISIETCIRRDEARCTDNHGIRLEIEVSGPDAPEATRAVRALIEDGFHEEKEGPDGYARA